MDSNALISKINNAISKLSTDEAYVFEADLIDAIDSVIEDWEGK